MGARSITCAIIEASSEILQSHLGMKVKAESPRVLATANAEYYVTSMIAIAGELRGLVSISMPPEAAIALTEKMLNVRLTSVGKETTDAVGELTNLIVGVGRRQFSKQSQLKVEMGLPIVTYGRGKTLQTPSDARTIQIPLATSIGPMSLMTSLATAPGAPRIAAMSPDGMSMVSAAELAASLRLRFGESKALPIHVSLSTDEIIAAALISVTDSEMTVIVDKVISTCELQLELSQHVTPEVQVSLTVADLRPVSEYTQVRGPFFLRRRDATESQLVSQG